MDAIYLEVIIDKNLKFGHVQNVSLLYPLLNCNTLLLTYKFTLYRALTGPGTTYASLIWKATTPTNSKKLQTM